MKIAYCADSAIPSRAANSVHVMKMCAAYTGCGQDVTLVHAKRELEESGVGDVFEFYGLEARFPIVQLPRIRGPLRKSQYGWYAARAARKLQPDLLHSRSLACCFFGALLGMKVAYEPHLPEESLLARRLLPVLLRHPGFLQLVVITEALGRFYEERYPTIRGRITVAPDGADAATECEPVRLDPAGKTHVGYVGHLYAGRGVEILAAAAESCPWAHFHFVGGLPEDIDRWRKQLEPLGNVTFHGFVSPRQAEQYRKAFDVLVAPYQRKVSFHLGGDLDTARWMSPLKLFEYMAVGKPIIASRLPVLEEVLSDGETALLCEPDRAEDWVRKLELLKADAALRSRLGERARKVFLERYTWRTRAERILAASSDRLGV